MDLSLYLQIESVVLPNLKNFDKAVQVAVLAFPQVRPETLRSIIAQLFQRFIKLNYRASHFGENRRKLYRDFISSLQSGTEQGIIVRLASQNKTSPALAAKVILEEYIKEELREEEALENIPSAHNPQDKKAVNVLRSRANQLAKNHALIEDCDLGYEILLAKLNDHCYGPIAESIKHSIGEEHEQKIKDKLKELNIPFSDEHVLRSRGYDKTPDVKLEVPVAVNGKIINWIESKALFGDRESHEGYLRDQFWSYWNRFGAGLVIYWFGYIKQLDNNAEDGIILSDHLPTDIVYFQPRLVSKSATEAIKAKGKIVTKSSNTTTTQANTVNGGSAKKVDRGSIGELIPTKRAHLSSIDESFSQMSIQEET
eukprot:TRINITY_DN3019_c0_g1_i6.p1 TRINITY_DN3019_c0_g1~~TRINITY_DN3019_c0_g1_i6.p1  ORF type:complete len:369 (-),score=73.67 TRINITY_DN3019_c0_g1_i6:1099-2205(-)